MFALAAQRLHARRRRKLDRRAVRAEWDLAVGTRTRGLRRLVRELDGLQPDQLAGNGHHVERAVGVFAPPRRG